MNDLFHREPDETLKETLLRTALHHQTTSTVDLDQGWEKISPQLRMASQPSSFPQAAHLFLQNAFRQPQEKPFLMRWYTIAASVALLFTLFGASVAGPLAGWLGGSQVAYAYAQVNQSQHNQRVTVTLVEAYASKAGTILVVKTREDGQGPAHDVYATFLHASLGYQQEFIPINQKFDLQFGSNNSPTCQAYSSPAVHPAADIHTVTLTWRVANLALSNTHIIKGYDNQVYRQTTIQGIWTFHFTIPFHQDYSKPGNTLHC